MIQRANLHSAMQLWTGIFSGCSNSSSYFMQQSATPFRFMLCIPNVAYTALLYHCQQSRYPCTSIEPTQTVSEVACQCQGLQLLLLLTSLILKSSLICFIVLYGCTQTCATTVSLLDTRPLLWH